ncbi:50S ribosomal protein L21 [Candidatus Nomurabacteria bacterium RIFCSPHIGHO2_01_FULL_42_16]|uniref:Large ribosomal subunit protein bL21 n=1 Tax=Candidatus Nomurabacteria bacterium RIFCSPHIGHO2_01_FULL_42_16 TaxID=1801743 RepID=A0A1F6VKK5_9BACT|nr:MAG: 50S ribosomal protein L21 [Candidatus Nomurabacteria bacterium RIFCSPHIGHO2_01_FULL_42_16]
MPKESENLKKNEFAVIQTGGKQYQVSAGDVLKIEKITGEFKTGDKISFDKVLLVDNGKEATIGMPYISGAKVEAELTEIGRAPKVTVIKYKAKSRYFKKRGHRQPYFKVKITSIK